jgi:hypothetical protein
VERVKAQEKEKQYIISETFESRTGSTGGRTNGSAYTTKSSPWKAR